KCGVLDGGCCAAQRGASPLTTTSPLTTESLLTIESLLATESLSTTESLLTTNNRFTTGKPGFTARSHPILLNPCLIL
ncbi:hypothetical protein, partial [Pseudomonas cyclaminis]|uniref:hypothetical protein n=2 Tax=Pseudomonas cyclaminis TaxID=2781239 RepID=UPI0019D4EFAC